MTRRITEEIELKTLIAPTEQAAGEDVIGGYIRLRSCPWQLEPVDFVVRSGALASGKEITVEVLEADDESGKNAEIVEGCTVEHISGSTGDAENQIRILIYGADVRKDCATVKVMCDDAGMPLEAFALMRRQYSESDAENESEKEPERKRLLSLFNLFAFNQGVYNGGED